MENIYQKSSDFYCAEIRGRIRNTSISFHENLRSDIVTNSSQTNRCPDDLGDLVSVKKSSSSICFFSTSASTTAPASAVNRFEAFSNEIPKQNLSSKVTTV